MSKKLFLMMSIIVLSIVAGSASATDINWNNDTVDGKWVTPGNWSTTTVPTISDKAKIVKLAPDDAHIGDGDAAECNWLVIGDGASGGLHMTGGTLKVGIAPGDTWTIVAYQATDVSVVTMDGGTINTADRVFVGFQGNGTLNMSGGTINIGGSFGIGFNDAGGTAGRGTVNLTGGTINVAPATGSATFNMSSPTGCIGHLDITGGTLTLLGDRTTVVQGYITSGYITAYNGLGDVIVTYDGTKTILTGATNPYKARGPKPASNTTSAAPYTALSWTAGDGALTHDVYFGTDAASVRDANTSTAGIYKGSQTRDANSFTPAGLEMGNVYYWRIDEVNDTNIYKGDLWQFVVATYAVIDDFENYADSTAMLASWSNNSTGASLSLAATGGHEKAKAMQFDYNNGNTPLYSEAQTNGPTADWTVAGVLAMDIWYKGDAANAAVPMYAAMEDNDGHPVAILVNSDPNAALVTDWTVWHVQLSDFAGVNLVNVKKLYIGLGSRTSPVAGGAGTVYFDDIKLYKSRCIAAPAQDLNGDCVVNLSDFAVMASNWLQLSQI